MLLCVMDRKQITRILERLGFVHVAGWVRKEDAPRIRARIDAARDDVDAARKAATKSGADGGYHTFPITFGIMCRRPEDVEKDLEKKAAECRKRLNAEWDAARKAAEQNETKP